VPKVFTSVLDDHKLLPHFIRHYAGAGFPSFYIAVPPGREGEIAQLTPRHELTIVSADVSDSYISGQATEPMQQLRARYQGEDEWALIVDLDEFVSFPESVSSIIASAEAEGANVVRGVMYDRFSADGRTVDLEPRSDLTKRYPVRARFIRDVMLGCDHKAVLVKGRLPGVPGAGHHYLVGEAVASKVLDVDHYKWTGGSIDRLRERCRALADDGIDWRAEYERAIMHYDAHGRFVWEEFGGELVASESELAPKGAPRTF
jgi:hypothetical protein